MSTAEKIAKLEALCADYRKVLHKVPHSRGDHSDLCRMENSGLPPKDLNHCHCHVKLVTAALQMDVPSQ